MKLLKTVLLLAVVLALLADGAAASPSVGLDPSFGNGGKSTVSVDAARDGYPKTLEMALGPEGRVYVLDNSLLLAFEADGTPAAGFGANGQVAVASAGEGEAKGLAVDSQGRVLVTGSVELGEQKLRGHRVSYARVYDAYVLRLLPNGERDVTFGNAGEVQTNFGLPRPTAGRRARYKRASALATSIVVDSTDRPIIGGGYVAAYEGCETIYSPDPFVGRLTVDGTVDTIFGGKGYGLVGGHGEVTALARTPEGGPATLSHGISCGARSEEEPSRFTAFNEGGEPSPGLDSLRPQFYMESEMAIDPVGRVLVVQTPPAIAEGQDTLDRLLPNGTLDPSFGKKGRVILNGPFRAVTAFTVDGQSRPILATARNGVELWRLDADGALDRSFGPGGRLYTHAPYARAVALDGDGRIYTVEEMGGTRRKPGERVQVARFLPGG
jgi:uncharacterized delta-60 repeat protein